MLSFIWLACHNPCEIFKAILERFKRVYLACSVCLSVGLFALSVLAMLWLSLSISQDRSLSLSVDLSGFLLGMAGSRCSRQIAYKVHKIKDSR
jgi:hypothetical protein